MSVLVTRTLGDLVAESPHRAAVLDRFGLDYCCHGDRTLGDACDAAGVEAADVSAQLSAVATPLTVDYPTEPAALADHIEATHHRYLHAELPELVALAAKVESVHGERHAELAEVARLVDELRVDLEPHLLTEEQVLFPAVRALAAGTREFRFGTVRNPIRMMSLDHEHAGELLVQLRQVTRDFGVPADGCASYHSLYERLEQLEADTHRHIHLENNVLFPAAIAVEATVSVDVTALARRGPSGAVWSLPHGGDLDANAVVITAGEAVGTHVNAEVDVMLVVMAGRGTVEIDGRAEAVAAGRLVHIPKGTARSVQASPDEALVYVTVHRSRRGLAIGGAHTGASKTNWA